MRILGFLFWAFSSSAAFACSSTVTIEHRPGGQTSFLVEIADGVFSRAKGLMFREQLSAQSGMLFVYDEEVKVSFWMKNVSFPLDMVFANSLGQIVSIHRNARPFDLTQIMSRSPFSLVLEINAGAAKSAQIQLGDHMTWKSVCDLDR